MKSRVRLREMMGRGGGCPKIKVAQNGLKYILVSEFLKSSEICEIRKILEVATSK